MDAVVLKTLNLALGIVLALALFTFMGLLLYQIFNSIIPMVEPIVQQGYHYENLTPMVEPIVQQGYHYENLN